MAIKDDLKQQAKKVALKLAMTSTVLTSPIQSMAMHQAETALEENRIEVEKPNFSNDEDVAVKIEAQPSEEQKAEALFNKLNLPVEGYEKNGALLHDENETFHIGNWGGDFRQAYEIRSGCVDQSLSREGRLYYQQRKLNMIKNSLSIDKAFVKVAPQRADELLDRNQIGFVSGWDGAPNQAYFSYSENKIFLREFQAGGKIVADGYAKEYTQGNPVAKASVLIHENAHEDHYSYDGIGELLHLPTNSARSDRLTETIATASQYLHAAYQYTLFKEQGVETVQIPRNIYLDDLCKKYEDIQDANKADLETYLKSLDVDMVKVTEETSLSRALEDYAKKGQKDGGTVVDYLKDKGFETFKMEESTTVGALLDDYVNWKGEEERPSFVDYIQQLDEKGTHIRVGDDVLYISDYLDKTLFVSDLQDLYAQENVSNIIEKYDLAQVNAKFSQVVSVEEFRDTLKIEENQSATDVLEKYHLWNTKQSKTYERSFSDVIPELVEIYNKSNGDELTDSLQKVGLKLASVEILEDRNVDDVLDMFPYLKDVVKEHGFNPKDPKSVKRVVEVASEYWHEKKAGGYMFQMSSSIKSAARKFAKKSWSEQLEILKNQEKDYQEVSTRMLKDVYIGHNMTVDLSSCRGLLDTLSLEDALDVTGAVMQYQQISYKEMKEIDDYLESKGLKTDEQKMGYMAKYLDNEAYRRGENRDAELTKILLSHNPNITYQDGVSVAYEAEGQIYGSSRGKRYNLTSYYEDAQTKIDVPVQQKKATRVMRVSRDRDS